jgi:uncharacterized SAM-binding protein YcdF (DUF218 family)
MDLRNRIRWSRWLGAVVLAGLVTSTVTPMWNIAGKYIAVAPEIEPADAIVVLAAGVMSDGSLNDESLRRAVHGFSLYKRGLAPKIVLSGPRNSDGIVEAVVRTKLALEMGIPADAVLQEIAVNTTRDEARRVGELLAIGNSSRILLVTESLHMRRARLVFERAGFHVAAAPSDDYAGTATRPEDRLKLMRRVLEEAGALVYYRIAGYI